MRRSQVPPAPSSRWSLPILSEKRRCPLRRGSGRRWLGGIVSLWAALFVACVSAQTQGEPLPALGGEWQMVEVLGVAVSEYGGESVPYIGFDTASRRVWGCSGCNRLVGLFTCDTATGAIDLSALGSTKMLCASMKLEDAVLRALSRAVRYGAADEGAIAFYDSEGEVVIRATPIHNNDEPQE